MAFDFFPRRTRWMVAALLFGLNALPAAAQLEVSCRLVNNRTLPYEPVGVLLTVVNNTGAPLDFTGEKANASLRFDVESQPGVLVRQLRDELVDGPFVIPSQKTMTREINLLESYDIRNAGPYMLSARVEWGNRIYASTKVSLEVNPGLEVDRLVCGIPGRPNELRAYTLHILSRDRNDHLFLRMDDEDAGVCFGVFDLGHVVRLYKPELKMDSKGNFHVLHQSGPWRYTLSIFSPDGKPLEHKFFTSEMSSITMEESSQGNVKIKGGERYEGSPQAPPNYRNVQDTPEKEDIFLPVKAH
ncbi:MAG: hypothetical protein V2A34_07660 [Lentisphaerota bacterium]